MRAIPMLLLTLACGGEEAVEALPDKATADVWGEVYDGSDPTVPFLPDQNARYWRYAFDRPATGFEVRVHGGLHDVRYQAFDLYDDETRTSVGAVRDTLLDSSFRFEVGGGDSALPIPEGVTRLALFLRLYDPEGRVPTPELPRVELYDTFDDVSLAPPDRIEPPEVPQALIDLFLEQLEIPQRDDRVDFYRLPADGLYAAFDNQYLAAQITRDPGQVLVLDLNPPSFGPSGEVRYWSLTQCDRHSFCHATLADLDAPSGPLQIVIGDDTPELRLAAGDRLFVPWATPDDEMVLIYRNLASSPDFTPSIDTVPLFDFAQPADGQEATATLGDRAPSGVRCDDAAFIAGTCPA